MPRASLHQVMLGLELRLLNAHRPALGRLLHQAGGRAMVPRAAGLGGELWAQRQEAWDSILAVSQTRFGLQIFI